MSNVVIRYSIIYGTDTIHILHRLVCLDSISEIFSLNMDQVMSDLH